MPSLTDLEASAAGTPKGDSRAGATDLDTLLSRSILVTLALIVALGAWFGYSYYSQQRAARQADPALVLIDQLTAALAKTPNDVAAHIRLGEALAAAGMYTDAKTELAVALKLSPDNAVAYQDLAQIALTTKDLANAEQYLLKLLTTTSTGAYQNVNSRRDFALFNLGEIALTQKRYIDAIGFLNAALRVNKAASDTYLRLAQAHQGNGDAVSALENVKIALEFDPTFAEALYFEGTLLLAGGDVANAAWDFRASMDSNPDQAEPRAALAKLGTYEEWFAKARAAFSSGKMADALTAAQVSRSIDPSSFEAAMLHGQVLVKQEKYSDAVAAFETAVQIDPQSKAAAAALKEAQTSVKGSTSK